MANDLHKKPFREHTKNKLDLFQGHAKRFMCVFIRANTHDWQTKKVRIYDFFCGPGRDETGQWGSPLLLLDALREFSDDISRNKIDVRVLCNDCDEKKAAHLKLAIEAEGLHDGPWKIDYHTEDFGVLFNRVFPSMSGCANLILLDQHGIRHFTSDVFDGLRSLPSTDTIIFMSSSYASRFKETPGINKYLNAREIFPEHSNYFHVHRAITEYFRSLIPSEEEYYLIPYSFKSGSNIYGVIFASANALGAEKFLEIAWNLDRLTGEANYLIDGDKINLESPQLFADMDKPTKLQLFERESRSKLLSGELSDTGELYRYVLRSGFLQKHIRGVLKTLVKEKRIRVEFTNLGYNDTRTPRPICVL